MAPTTTIDEVHAHNPHLLEEVSFTITRFVSHISTARINAASTRAAAEDRFHDRRYA